MDPTTRRSLGRYIDQSGVESVLGIAAGPVVSFNVTDPAEGLHTSLCEMLSARGICSADLTAGNLHGDYRASLSIQTSLGTYSVEFGPVMSTLSEDASSVSRALTAALQCVDARRQLVCDQAARNALTAARSPMTAAVEGALLASASLLLATAGAASTGRSGLSSLSKHTAFLVEQATRPAAAAHSSASAKQVGAASDVPLPSSLSQARWTPRPPRRISFPLLSGNGRSGGQGALTLGSIGISFPSLTSAGASFDADRVAAIVSQASVVHKAVGAALLAAVQSAASAPGSAGKGGAPPANAASAKRPGTSAGAPVAQKPQAVSATHTNGELTTAADGSWVWPVEITGKQPQVTVPGITAAAPTTAPNATSAPLKTVTATGQSAASGKPNGKPATASKAGAKEPAPADAASPLVPAAAPVKPAVPLVWTQALDLVRSAVLAALGLHHGTLSSDGAPLTGALEGVGIVVDIGADELCEPIGAMNGEVGVPAEPSTASAFRYNLVPTPVPPPAAGMPGAPHAPSKAVPPGKPPPSAVGGRSSEGSAAPEPPPPALLLSADFTEALAAFISQAPASAAALPMGDAAASAPALAVPPPVIALLNPVAAADTEGAARLRASVEKSQLPAIRSVPSVDFFFGALPGAASGGAALPPAVSVGSTAAGQPASSLQLVSGVVTAAAAAAAAGQSLFYQQSIGVVESSQVAAEAAVALGVGAHALQLTAPTQPAARNLLWSVSRTIAETPAHWQSPVT